MMSIVMSGGIYCPLSPRDPEHRLHSLLQQTQSRLVLVHSFTKTKFNNDVISFDIDSILTSRDIKKNTDIEQFSDVIITRENIAYIIFTSDSVGTPKGVSFLSFNLNKILYMYHYIGSNSTL
jgi:fengycin family lipopeptide synthetase D